MAPDARRPVILNYGHFVMNILALTPRPLEGPDTRYRILQYGPYLERAGLVLTHKSLISPSFYRKQQKKDLHWPDALAFAGRVLERAFELVRRQPYEVIWLARELMPLGPPLLERLLFTRSPQSRVVLDVDDALFERDEFGGFLHKRLRDFKKYEYITPRCAATVVGNRYLADYYSRLAPGRVHLIPTCVDHEKYAAVTHRPPAEGRLRIGWIGTATNRGHLGNIRGPLERLSRRYPLEFRAVGLNEPLNWDMEHAYAIPWRLDKELDYFADFDIGVMPLDDTAFTRGKCAFKLIQYMAAGVPAVASPVGANRETLLSGEQGFFAAAPEEWEQALETLLKREDLRRAMSRSGRERVREKFSLAAYGPVYVDILRGSPPAPIF